MAKQLSLDVTPIDLREPLLTAAQAAKPLSVRPSWIDAVRSGHLPCVRIGKAVRFLRSDLERWVGEQRAIHTRYALDEDGVRALGGQARRAGAWRRSHREPRVR